MRLCRFSSCHVIKLVQFDVTSGMGQTFTFLGQGETIQDCIKDGLENLQGSFRPKQDGRVPQVNAASVRQGVSVSHLTLQQINESWFK